MNADEMKAILDTSLAQMMCKINLRFDKLDAKVDQKASKEDIDRLFNSVDAFAKRLEISDDERIVMSHQLERLDTWVHQLADKIGVTLSA
jgi:hypothetical protein